MVAIAHFDDGTSREIPVPAAEFSKPTMQQAVKYAESKLSASERAQIRTWSIEEDFV